MLALVAALFGVFAAGTSTSDFVTHLDGQTHAVQCSILPAGAAVVGASGCKSAMYSVYSSFFRTSLWGGLPVSLLAMGVFSFFAAFSLKQLLRPSNLRRAGLLLVVASLIPVATSVIYAVIAGTKLGTFCQVCIAIYTASGLLLVAGLGAWLRAPKTPRPESGWVGYWALHAGLGTGIVLLLVAIYAFSVPDPRPTMEGCGFLTDSRDDAGVLLHPNPSTLPVSSAPRPSAIAVLDPLCPACRTFDQRFHASGFYDRVDLRMLLFPLDAKCNWMVKDSPHPGACAVSEAMLCSPDAAPRILAWAFADQERLTELGKNDEPALRKELVAAFPETASCVGTADARAKLNKSMRFAVKNALPVQTPQLFVDGRRLCDEDSDLGLEYVLNKWLEAPPVAAPGAVEANP